MRGLRAAGSIRANSPKLKNHRLSRWIFICGIKKAPVEGADLELLTGFEPVTSSLPRTCSTN